MSKYIVAVSGGVDSVVLLHRLVQENTHELIVAHFDHGIRPDSSADARFVEELAKHYKLFYEVKREELGTDASEAYARERRYAFLRDVAAQHDATIVTAHHRDDIIETIAINMTRGTGWRGLAVFKSDLAIERPQLHLSKTDIYEYALQHELEWVEDETNMSDTYLRNRLRKKITTLASEVKSELIGLWQSQSELRTKIESEETLLLSKTADFSRYFFTHIDNDVAIELLRAAAKFQITRPQAERALHAIKTLSPGATSELGSGVRLKFSQRAFTIQTL